MTNVIGIKDDTGKDRDDIFFAGFAISISQVIKVTSEGAKKYGNNNWQLVDDPIRRFSAAMSRHMRKYFEGEWVNEEDFGLPHLAHVAWCCLAIMYFVIVKKIDYFAELTKIE